MRKICSKKYVDIDPETNKANKVSTVSKVSKLSKVSEVSKVSKVSIFTMVHCMPTAGDKMGPRCFLVGNGRRHNGAKMFSCWQRPEAKQGQDVFLLATAGGKTGPRVRGSSARSGTHLPID